MTVIRSLPHDDFLGVPLTTATTRQWIDWAVDTMADGAGAQLPVLVTYLNAWCFVIAGDKPDYAAQLREQFHCVYSDGKGVVWGARYCGLNVPERINAADFIVDFWRSFAEKNLRAVLYGSEPGVAADAAKAWQRQVPGLQILETWSGFQSAEEEEAMFARIAELSPDLLIVGKGVPKQEQWILEHATSLKVRMVWAVGAMMEYHAGHRARAPEWVRAVGLEWLFRLMLEPKRLFRRYLLGNLQFIYRVLTKRRVG